MGLPSSGGGGVAVELQPHISSQGVGQRGLLPEERESDQLPLLNTPQGGKQEEREEEGGSSMSSAVFNLATTIIGAGIMALPATMKVLGLPLGLLMIGVMGALSEVTLEILIYFSAKTKTWTYGETVRASGSGRSARSLPEICIIVNNAGILVVYLIIMGDVMAGSPSHVGLFEQWAGGTQGWWCNRKLIIFLTMVLVLAPLVSLKRIDSLRFTSAISVALAIVFVILCSGIAAVKLVRGKLDSPPRLLPDFGSPLQLLVVIPIMTNAYICHFNAQPIYLELRDRSPQKMYRVGRISALLCTLVYSLTALSGYLLFGDSTASDVLSNFDQNLGIPYSSLLNGLIRVGYIIHLMLVFPVIHFSLRQTVYSLFFPAPSQPLADNNIRFALLTFILLLLVYLGSALIPNIWIAFEFTGATTGLALGFMFPSLIAITWRGEGWKALKPIRCISWVMLTMAILVSVIGIIGNVTNLVYGDKS